jgi:hypothetical protein
MLTIYYWVGGKGKGVVARCSLKKRKRERCLGFIFLSFYLSVFILVALADAVYYVGLAP